jgi:hypothetical protein
VLAVDFQPASKNNFRKIQLNKLTGRDRQQSQSKRTTRFVWRKRLTLGQPVMASASQRQIQLDSL